MPRRQIHNNFYAGIRRAPPLNDPSPSDNIVHPLRGPLSAGSLYDDITLALQQVEHLTTHLQEQLEEPGRVDDEDPGPMRARLLGLR